MESAIEDPVRRAARNEAKKSGRILSRGKIHSREKGGHFSVTWRLAIGYSGYPLETRPTLFSADGNFEKPILRSPLLPNLETGEQVSK